MHEPLLLAHSPFDAQTLTYLSAWSRRFPSIDAVLAEMAHLRTLLTLPRGTLHVVSDVHGEYKKLKHIINNASGSLRPLVERIFSERLDEAGRLELLSFIYYPRESWTHRAATLSDPASRLAFLRRIVSLEAEMLRAIVQHYSLHEADKVFPAPFQGLFRELLLEPQLERSGAWLDAMLEPFVAHDRDVELLRHMAHVIRNLSIRELIVAGDLGDRGPRIDKVIDYIMKQANVAFTWGNHDMSWMGACLGQEACIATVMRLSLRYGRLAQLEEGYGIPVEPVEVLAAACYGDDPAERFCVHEAGQRDPLSMARMQKAAAILQFKLEGQVSLRNPRFGMEHRSLLHRIDISSGTVTIEGRSYPLLDRHFPTVDWSDPYRLSPEEHVCMNRLRESFLASRVLWEQMSYVARRGAVHLKRDDNLIFHGCVPVDEEGEPLGLTVDGLELRGRALFEALNLVVHRAVRRREPRDLDMLWYLWTGPLSPMFGKDRMATFEAYFVADRSAHLETKNPYFKLIHESEFCQRIFGEFGIDPQRGLIVNGHVPVRLEKGESPLKKSGLAVTIDGAFSEAYGDRGYTLVLDADRTYLALHHHFESVDEAIVSGADIIPEIQELRRFEPPRRVEDTEQGEGVRRELNTLELLIRAYRENLIQEEVG